MMDFINEPPLQRFVCPACGSGGGGHINYLPLCHICHEQNRLILMLPAINDFIQWDRVQDFKPNPSQPNLSPAIKITDTEISVPIKLRE